MRVEDFDIIRAERDASPIRFHSYDPHDDFQRRYGQLHPGQQETMAPQVTRSSTTSSSAGSGSGDSTRPRAPDRQTTQRDDIEEYLERHPTALERIQTHRMQHMNTVGSSAAKGRKDLPNFGGQKPYPPMLPEKEEYVVEFDGHDDPLHAQNWPMKKK